MNSLMARMAVLLTLAGLGCAPAEEEVASSDLWTAAVQGCDAGHEAFIKR
ncbi:MAG: hypothetical protein ACI9OJ_001608, partial [Myxococcota bacterium]